MFKSKNEFSSKDTDINRFTDTKKQWCRSTITVIFLLKTSEIDNKFHYLQLNLHLDYIALLWTLCCSWCVDNHRWTKKGMKG